MREGGDQVKLRDGVYFELKHGSLDILIFICNLSERDKGQCLLITPIFKRLRQKDFKFKASLGCKKSSRQPWNTLVRPCLNKKVKIVCIITLDNIPSALYVYVGVVLF